jgi:hypothetical protein
VDEPSLGLAPQLVDTIFDLISDIHGGGLTIVLVSRTHSEHADLRAVYGARFRNFQDLHAAIVHRIVVGQWIFDEELITGWQPRPVHAVAAYCVDDGLIASVQLYVDRDE